MSITIKTGICMLCGQDSFLEVSDDVFARIMVWSSTPMANRPFIQDAFPDLSAADREQILNGSHDACFDEAFSDVEDRDDYLGSL